MWKKHAKIRKSTIEFLTGYLWLKNCVKKVGPYKIAQVHIPSMCEQTKYRSVVKDFMFIDACTDRNSFKMENECGNVR